MNTALSIIQWKSRLVQILQCILIHLIYWTWQHTDFWFLPELKMTMKSKHFFIYSDIEAAMTPQLKIHKGELLELLQKVEREIGQLYFKPGDLLSPRSWKPQNN